MAAEKNEKIENSRISQRMDSAGGRKVLSDRRAKGRKSLSVKTGEK